MKVLRRLKTQYNLILGFLGELGSEKSYRGIERLVQLTLQALLDLGLMAISAIGGTVPERYSDIGDELFKLGILKQEDAKLLKSMAGLRNILVHAYAVIDKKKVLEAARKLRFDAVRIAENILKEIGEKPIDPMETQNLKETVEKLSSVLKGRVRVAFLFGGRVKGYVLKGDYDLAVYLRDDYSLLDLGEIHAAVVKELNIPEEKLDLICLNSASPKIVLEALKGIPVIVEDPYDVFLLKTRALIELLDVSEGEKAIGKRT